MTSFYALLCKWSLNLCWVSPSPYNLFIYEHFFTAAMCTPFLLGISQTGGTSLPKSIWTFLKISILNINVLFLCVLSVVWCPFDRLFLKVKRNEFFINRIFGIWSTHNVVCIKKGREGLKSSKYGIKRHEISLKKKIGLKEGQERQEKQRQWIKYTGEKGGQRW